MAWLFELDQFLPQIRQAIGCTFALGPFLVIFVKGHRGKRRLPFVQISATEQVLSKTGAEVRGIFFNNAFQLRLRLRVEFSIPQPLAINIGVYRMEERLVGKGGVVKVRS